MTVRRCSLQGILHCMASCKLPRQMSHDDKVRARRTQTSSEVTDVKKYRTRIVSTATKANLEYEEAAPPLTEGLIRSVSGLF